MVADSDLPYFLGYSKQSGRKFGALALGDEETCDNDNNNLWTFH